MKRGNLIQTEHSAWHILKAGNLPGAVIISNLSEPQFPLLHNAIQVPPSQGYCEAESGGAECNVLCKQKWARLRAEAAALGPFVGSRSNPVLPCQAQNHQGSTCCSLVLVSWFLLPQAQSRPI